MGARDGPDVAFDITAAHRSIDSERDVLQAELDLALK